MRYIKEGTVPVLWIAQNRMRRPLTTQRDRTLYQVLLGTRQKLVMGDTGEEEQCPILFGTRMRLFMPYGDGNVAPFSAG